LECAPAPCHNLSRRARFGNRKNEAGQRFARHPRLCRLSNPSMSAAKYTLGLDYGTNSVRALLVNVTNGREVASAVWNYATGTHGVILSRDPNLARQHPADYVTGAEVTISKALAAAKRTVRGFSPQQVIGIGVDTTGSTPLPVDGNGRPLALN